MKGFEPQARKNVDITAFSRFSALKVARMQSAYAFASLIEKKYLIGEPLGKFLLITI